MQDVPYWRENAELAKLLAVMRARVTSDSPKTNIELRERIELPPSHEPEIGEAFGL